MLHVSTARHGLGKPLRVADVQCHGKPLAVGHSLDTCPQMLTIAAELYQLMVACIANKHVVEASQPLTSLPFDIRARQPRHLLIV